MWRGGRLPDTAACPSLLESGPRRRKDDMEDEAKLTNAQVVSKYIAAVKDHDDAEAIMNRLHERVLAIVDKHGIVRECDQCLTLGAGTSLVVRSCVSTYDLEREEPKA